MNFQKTKKWEKIKKNKLKQTEYPWQSFHETTVFRNFNPAQCRTNLTKYQ